MDRLNHVKIVTPEPELVDAFLREVVDVPEGWPLAESAGAPRLSPDAPLGPGGSLTQDDVMRNRGAGEPRGFITGSPESRQFQIFHAAEPKIWAICVGTRDIEGAFERCRARGIPATPVTVADWNDCLLYTSDAADE